MTLDQTIAKIEVAIAAARVRHEETHRHYRAIIQAKDAEIAQLRAIIDRLDQQLAEQG